MLKVKSFVSVKRSISRISQSRDLVSFKLSQHSIVTTCLFDWLILCVGDNDHPSICWTVGVHIDCDVLSRNLVVPISQRSDVVEKVALVVVGAESALIDLHRVEFMQSST